MHEIVKCQGEQTLFRACYWGHRLRPQLLSIRSGGVQISYSFLPFSIEFRVLPKAGPLLAILDSLNGSLLELRIDNQHLVLEADSKQVKQSSLPALDVGDGSWHALSVKLRGGRLDVDLDGYTVLWLEGSLVRKIGLKMTSFRLLATGCYRSATVDLKSVLVVQGEVIKERCEYRDKCLPNPCENHGQCQQTDLDQFKCECGKYYAGAYCHTCKPLRTRRYTRRFLSKSSSILRRLFSKTPSSTSLSIQRSFVPSPNISQLSESHNCKD